MCVMQCHAMQCNAMVWYGNVCMCVFMYVCARQCVHAFHQNSSGCDSTRPHTFNVFPFERQMLQIYGQIDINYFWGELINYFGRLTSTVMVRHTHMYYIRIYKHP